jgi:hypothetical protein
MLAQSFMSAADLDITDRERDALIGVLGMLERGELHHARIVKYWDSEEYRKAPVQPHSGLFNMDQFFGEAKCGTAACLAGTCDWVYGTDFTRQYFYVFAATDPFTQPRDEDTNARLAELFMPIRAGRSWDAIKPKQAALALRSYLTCGDPHWERYT